MHRIMQKDGLKNKQGFLFDKQTTTSLIRRLEKWQKLWLYPIKFTVVEQNFIHIINIYMNFKIYNNNILFTIY